MRLEDVHQWDDLSPLQRHKRRDFDERTIIRSQLEKYLRDGWELGAERTRTVTVRRKKAPATFFEDRVWAVLYAMGFTHMSGASGAKLISKAGEGEVPNQLDVVAIDDDVALFIECKTLARQGRHQKLDEVLAKQASLVRPFADAVHKGFPAPQRRKVAPVLWTQNTTLSENDQLRADERRIKIFNETELTYYEQLVSQIREAARFQFLADVFEGREIPGLTQVVPAIRMNLGPTRCYAFPIAPSNLLKIAYVSHKTKGSAVDVGTYQRLFKKAKMTQIRDFLNKQHGFFPTNIVVGINSKVGMRFDPAKIPESMKDIDSGTVGWLYLPQKYKAAWVIDGQHRLFAYAGSDRAETARIAVIAFENLEPGRQAQLFVDINSKQKAVSKNLLDELWADLAWDSTDFAARARAISVKAVLLMDELPDSPYFGRIKTADSRADDIRCITLQELSTQVNRPELLLGFSKAGPVFGALWNMDGSKALRRTASVCSAFTAAAIDSVRDIWDLGRSKEGGYIGNNNVAGALIRTLGSVLQHLREGRRLAVGDMTTEDLCDHVIPYAQHISRYFGSAPIRDLEYLRSQRGSTAQVRIMRRFQAAIRERDSSFRPEGLDEFLAEAESQTNEEAHPILVRIERLLHQYIIGSLKLEFGDDNSGWWTSGVPIAIRKKIAEGIEEEGRGASREEKFSLIYYHAIVQKNWLLFRDTLGDGKKNAAKDDATRWLQRLNDIRNTVAHPQRRPITVEDLEFVREREGWLKERLKGNTDTGTGSADEDEDE